MNALKIAFAMVVAVAFSVWLFWYLGKRNELS